MILKKEIRYAAPLFRGQYGFFRTPGGLCYNKEKEGIIPKEGSYEYPGRQ